MAERVGFEPTVRCRITGFQDQLLKPLGHLSVKCFTIIATILFNVKFYLILILKSLTYIMAWGNILMEYLLITLAIQICQFG